MSRSLRKEESKRTEAVTSCGSDQLAIESEYGCPMGKLLCPVSPCPCPSSQLITHTWANVRPSSAGSFRRRGRIGLDGIRVCSLTATHEPIDRQDPCPHLLHPPAHPRTSTVDIDRSPTTRFHRSDDPQKPQSHSPGPPGRPSRSLDRFTSWGWTGRGCEADEGWAGQVAGIDGP